MSFVRLSLGLVCMVLLGAVGVSCLDNGLGRTPAMGYNTWNNLGCNVSAATFLSIVDQFVALNLTKHGYEYVNMDDCWAEGRFANGTVYPDATSFPDGISAVADAVHAQGLKFGIYTDRGNLTCAGRPGSLGYEKVDAYTYASWGVDYLKEDSCHATTNHTGAFAEYGLMRDALNATGRDIYFSLCGWNAWYSPVGSSLGNSWRIAGDCTSWPSIQNAIDVNSRLAANAGPGGWNDPDMLVGSSGEWANVTPEQSRTQFSMWCVGAAPLLIGVDLKKISAWDLQTYTNDEAIAVDQDVLGAQGFKLAGGNLTDNTTTFNVWGRHLSTGDWVVVFVNNSPDSPAEELVCDEQCFQAMGFSDSDSVSVRDLWTHTDNGTITTASYAVYDVAANGGSVMLLLSAAT